MDVAAARQQCEAVVLITRAAALYVGDRGGVSPCQCALIQRRREIWDSAKGAFAGDEGRVDRVAGRLGEAANRVVNGGE